MLTKHQEQTFLCAITQKDYSRPVIQIIHDNKYLVLK